MGLFIYYKGLDSRLPTRLALSAADSHWMRSCIGFPRTGAYSQHGQKHTDPKNSGVIHHTVTVTAL
jgi:hypothetical protein